MFGHVDFKTILVCHSMIDIGSMRQVCIIKDKSENARE